MSAQLCLEGANVDCQLPSMQSRRRKSPPKPFGLRLAQLIQLRGYRNRAAFLRAAGLENQTVARWENEETTPRGALLIRAAEALGVSIGVVLGTEPVPASIERVDRDDYDGMLEDVRVMMNASDAELRWLATSPRFHQQTVGSLIDTLRAQRQGMSAEQAAASRAETERYRDATVPRRAKRA